MSFSKLLILVFFVALFSCEKEPIINEQLPDTSPPEIVDSRWIDNPSNENDLGGLIIDGENYTISIIGGFQFIAKIDDESKLTQGEIYFLANNDETIRHSVLNKSNVLNTESYSVGCLFNHDGITREDGTYYNFKEGDTLYFYLTIEDEFGYETSMQWTADLIE